jgi:hypothetical protein
MAMTMAERSRSYRARRRAGERPTTVDIRKIELDAFVSLGFLTAANNNNRGAIADALGQLLERIPPKYWPSVDEVVVGTTVRKFRQS